MTTGQPAVAAPGVATPAAPPLAIEDAAVAAPAVSRKRWVAGTLTYTTGSLAALFFFLLWGDFAWALKERAVPPILQLLLKQLKASDFVVATMIGFLPQAMAVVLIPVISYRSDRHRGRWGRRIPYLLLPTPFAVLSMIGLAYSPVIGSWLHRAMGLESDSAALVLLSFGAFWVIFELSGTVCQAVFTGLINDVVPPEVIGRFYGLFRVFGLTAGMVFNYFLFGRAETHYVQIFLGIAVLYGVSFTVMCLRVTEPRHPRSPDVDTQPAGGTLRKRFGSAAVSYARQCFRDPGFRAYYASLALANMAFQPILLFSLYFAGSVGMSMDTLGKITTLQLLVSLVQAYPLGWLADKIHPLRVTILAAALYAATAAAAFAFARDARSFAVAHVACGVLAGCWLTATAALAPAVLPRERFAQFNSAAWLCTSLGIMVAAPLSGWLLDLLNQRYYYIYLWAVAFMVPSLYCAIRLHRRAFAGRSAMPRFDTRTGE